MYLATQFTWSSVRDLHAAVLLKSNAAGLTGEILLLIWSQGSFKSQLNLHLGRGLRVRKAPLQFSFAGIFNTAPVSQTKTTTVHLGVNENGCSTFVRGAGWTRVSPLAIQNFQKNVLWQRRKTPPLP